MEEMGIMRTRIGWLALVLIAGMAQAPAAVWGQEAPAADPAHRFNGGALHPAAPGTDLEREPGPQAPADFLSAGLVPALLAPVDSLLPPRVARGQEVPPPDPVFPVPLYSPRPELGGFFFNMEFVYMRQTNPLKHQVIAVRGFVDTDGTINGTPGAFYGSGQDALNAKQASGPGTYVPGYRFGLGYRFRNGVTTELWYLHLFNARFQAGATLAPPPGQIDPLLANTFLFSPVFNFPTDFAGPLGVDVAPGGPRAAYGIWNAAEEEIIKFEQRLDRWELRFRIPIWETDYDPCHNPDKLGLRLYGLCGFRHTWLWERFQWRVVDRDINGAAGPEDVATYSNVVSQPMYGGFIGWGFEKYLGHGVALTMDLTGVAYINFVREIARFERGDEAVGSKRANREYTIAPEAQAHFNLWWYPIEGVQFRVGYDVIGIFNTIASPEPVDFNFTAPAPRWEHKAVRLIDGFNVGVGFIF
jgi:hypothetical protein